MFIEFRNPLLLKIVKLLLLQFCTFEDFMKIDFYKFQGTGNDFIMLDNRDGRYNELTISQIEFLCNRKTGIGSDGLIKLNDSQTLDFEMDFYNPDGSRSFCGNGARCTIAFAEKLGISKTNYEFLAIDGIHQGTYNNEEIGIDIKDVNKVEKRFNDFILDSGSPHFIKYTQDISTKNTLEIGRAIRYSKEFNDSGININLVCKDAKDVIRISTYERGVENETLSCGTGATACALVQGILEEMNEGKVHVITKGGALKVHFTRINDSAFENIWLFGPATFVFEGSITW